MLRDNLTQPIYVSDSDPWMYTVLNNTLTSLKNRDDQIADAVDAGGGLGGYPISVTVAGGTISVNYLPASWTITKTGTGLYTITHNIGNTNYIVLPAVVNSTPLVATLASLSNNSFVISVFNQSGALTDSSFTSFISRYG